MQTCSNSLTYRTVSNIWHTLNMALNECDQIGVSLLWSTWRISNHNYLQFLFCLCGYVMCLCVLEHTLLCMLLWALLHSKTETPCQFKSPPLLSSHGGVFRGQAICLLLIHRPGSHQQVLESARVLASKQACQPAENTFSQVVELWGAADYILNGWVSER